MRLLTSACPIGVESHRAFRAGAIVPLRSELRTAGATNAVFRMRDAPEVAWRTPTWPTFHVTKGIHHLVLRDKAVAPARSDANIGAAGRPHAADVARRAVELDDPEVSDRSSDERMVFQRDAPEQKGLVQREATGGFLGFGVHSSIKRESFEFRPGVFRLPHGSHPPGRGKRRLVTRLSNDCSVVDILKTIDRQASRRVSSVSPVNLEADLLALSARPRDRARDLARTLEPELLDDRVCRHHDRCRVNPDTPDRSFLRRERPPPGKSGIKGRSAIGAPGIGLLVLLPIRKPAIELCLAMNRNVYSNLDAIHAISNL